MARILDYEQAAMLVLAEQPDAWSRQWTVKTAMARSAENIREMQILGQLLQQRQLTRTEFRTRFEKLMADPEFKEASEFMEKVQQRARLN